MPKPDSPGKSAEAPGQVKKTPAPVFLFEQVICLPADLPGPDSAAVLAALNSGRRPTGPAYVESQVNRGADVLLTWAVPVGAA